MLYMFITKKQQISSNEANSPTLIGGHLFYSVYYYFIALY